MPAFLQALLKTFWIVVLAIGCPFFWPSKRYLAGLYAFQYILNMDSTFSDKSVYLYFLPFPRIRICLRSESMSGGCKFRTSEILSPEEYVIARIARCFRF